LIWLPHPADFFSFEPAGYFSALGCGRGSFFGQLAAFIRVAPSVPFVVEPLTGLCAFQQPWGPSPFCPFQRRARFLLFPPCFFVPPPTSFCLFVLLNVWGRCRPWPLIGSFLFPFHRPIHHRQVPPMLPNFFCWPFVHLCPSFSLNHTDFSKQFFFFFPAFLDPSAAPRSFSPFGTKHKETPFPLFLTPFAIAVGLVPSLGHGLPLTRQRADVLFFFFVHRRHDSYLSLFHNPVFWFFFGFRTGLDIRFSAQLTWCPFLRCPPALHFHGVFCMDPSPI